MVMPPNMQENVPLKDFSTMRLGGPARYLVEAQDYSQIIAVDEWATAQNLPVIMIGRGSNIVWRDEGFPGVVIVNRIMGYDLQDQGMQQYLMVGAGENWDSVVERTVNAGLTGIEALSLIPGTTGATPIQNVGAYGKEIADTLICVQAYDRTEKKMVILSKADCNFSYRNSRFKQEDKGRFFITSVTLALTKGRPLPPYYGAVEAFFSTHNVSTKDVTAETLRNAVIAIRSEKLPDPASVANCGSFFHNPIIEMDRLVQLRNAHPLIAYWETDDGKAKVSAGWLLEQLGLKGYHEPNTGMATWPHQALVFVNEKATSTAQLLAFRDAVSKAVKDRFGIDLVQEPELI